jgi:4-amino-4-deoxy-L-arabinose transferase-like glycosyltransferase
MIREQPLPRIRLHALPGLLAALIVLALATINLSAYPATWFDEGQYLHVPRALLQHGVYADWSSEGPRYYGPTTAAGPTVLLPIAGVFWLFGAGLFQARLVMVGYLLAALLLCFLVADRIYGRRAAILATALLLCSRGAATLLWGRQVLGEVPALVFVLAGLWLWQGALLRRCGRRALLAGICWGLGMITKNQAALALTPALALLALLDWFYYRNGRWSLRLLPLLAALGLYGGWLLILFAALGPGDLAENLTATRKATGGALLVLTPEAAGRALRLLVSPRLYGGLLLPALLYGAWRLRGRRDRAAQSQAAILLIVGTWSVWFVSSLGWPRYAYIGAALGALPVARLLIDGWDWLRRRRPWIALPALATTLGLLLGLPLLQTVREIARPDRSVLRFAAYLERAVPRAALIETWEPELGGLTDHRYHYPPQSLLDVAVRHQWQGAPPARYDLEQLRAPYLVIGPFGAWTGVYAGEQVRDRYQPIHQEGPYRLYRRLP